MLKGLARASFHILSILAISLGGLWLPHTTTLIALGAVAVIFLSFELLRRRYSRVNNLFFFLFRPMLRDYEKQQFTGAAYTLIGSFIAFLIFPQEVAALAVAFLAVGDPLAAIAGRHIGRREIFKRTLEGDITCFLACMLVGLIFYWSGVYIELPVIVAGAFAATMAEAIQLPVNDNLIMPLLAALVMTMLG